MKKIKFILLFFVLSLTLSGQMVTTSVYFSKPIIDTLYDEYKTIYDAFTTKPTGDTIAWQEAFVYSLDSLGVWDSLSIVYVNAGSSQADAFRNWQTPGTFDITDPGTTAPTFTAYQGITFNGTDEYLSTNFNPYEDSASVYYKKNSGTIMIYSRLNVDGYALAGVRQSGNYTRLYPRSGGTMSTLINSGSTLANTNTDSRGLITATRRSITIVENYRNAASLDATPDAKTSTALPNGDIFLGAYNLVGSGAAGFYNCEISVVIITGGLTSTRVAKIYAIVQRLMTRLGKNV